MHGHHFCNGSDMASKKCISGKFLIICSNNRPAIPGGAFFFRYIVFQHRDTEVRSSTEFSFSVSLCYFVASVLKKP
jgi:hypothetical protein